MSQHGHIGATVALILSAWLGTTSILNAQIFYDNFEYDASRDATNVELVFRSHGWTDVKANNSYFGRGAGYLYTQYDSTRQSRVLVMESNPSQSPINQTDYWLKYGSQNTPLTTIPANVWFQFWIYGTPESRFHRSKFLYPCRAWYPCVGHDIDGDSIPEFAWLFGIHKVIGPNLDNPPVTAPDSGWVWHLRAPLANNQAEASYNRDKLYPNLTNTWMKAGQWYQVRIHIDLSGEQGAYEAWLREDAQAPWTKIAEWIGNVTPQFEWPIPPNERVGNRVLAMPTTVNVYDNKFYMDDFVMAASVNDLELLTSVEDGHTKTGFHQPLMLYQNFPNPFATSTTIKFQLLQPERAALTVLDILGNRVATLVEGDLPAGEHSVVFSGAQVPAGMYVYRLVAGGRVEQRLMQLVK